MNRQSPAVAPEHLVMLAAMECFASCVLTYIRMIGGGRLPPMPDYWNLSYQFRTLLSSKDAKQYSLHYHYGVRMNFARGDGRQLREEIAGGKMAVLLCAASRWSYFPARMLGLETAGFQHSVLICGWDDAAGTFRIADPMVGHIGDASLEEAERAGMRGDGRRELHYFTLELPGADFRPPTAAEAFRYSCERNLRLFDPPLAAEAEAMSGAENGATGTSEAEKRQAWAEWFGGRNSGSKAFAQCAADLAALPEWERAALNRWCDRNNLTVTSIWKVRQHVWDAFCRLQVMNEAETREAGGLVRRIVRQWQSFNFQLSKLKRAGACTPADASSLGAMLAELGAEERRFLTWMNDLGKSIAKEALES